MSQDDLEVAMQYWQNIRQCVINDHISPEHFWSVGDDKKFHVRPKAIVADDIVETPHGHKAKKYCYWFNAKYVKNIIENEI